MASSPFPQPQQPPFSDYIDPPLAIPLLLPAPPPPPPPPPSRRLPPPCWTPEETFALIDSYRQKWYSLRRGNLRAPHWQDVADDVHRLCPNVALPKTAIQCRHKMEKLRKRYRTELQRAKSIPHHRFSSSWIYFSKMDLMEKGDSMISAAGGCGGGGGGGVSVSVASTSVSPVVFAVDNDDDNGGDDGDGDGDGDDGDEEEDYSGGSFRKELNEPQRNGLRIRITGNSRKSYGGFEESPNPNPNPNLNPKLRELSSLRYNEIVTPPPMEEVRYASRNGGLGMGMGMNVMAKKKRSALGKRGREMERERGDNVTMEMVEAIRVLGEGFLRMEKMKMEMMRETERVRMENEMRRTEMILQSQQQIVEAFAKGWSDLIVDGNEDDKNNNEDAS